MSTKEINGVTINVSFNEAVKREALQSGESLSTSLGKIQKFMATSPTPIPFVLEIGDWATNTVLDVSSAYMAEIQNGSITSADGMRVDFDPTVMKVCEEAQVSFAGRTEDGKGIVFADKIPTETLNGVYYIFKSGG